jgi:hypothetical protein
MKKYFLLFIAIFAVLSGNVFSQTVYISATGQHYHTLACKNVNKNSTQMQVSDALNHGYTPCKICHPPMKPGKSATNKKGKKNPAKAPPAKSKK